MIALVIPLLLWNYEKWIPFIKSGYFLWCCLLAVVYSLNYYRMVYGGYSYSELDLILETNRLQRVVLWPVIGFIVFSVDAKFFRTGFFLLLFIAPSLVILDFLDPSILGPPNEGLNARAQGAYLNANLAAEAALLLCILNLRKISGFFGILIFTLVSLGVLFTFSRSGIAALVLLFCYMYARGNLPKISFVLPIVLIISFSTFLVYIEDALLFLGYDASVTNVLDRLRFFEAVETDKITADSSGESRAAVAKDVFSASLSNPFGGHVFDAYSTYGLNPHNQPLFLWYKFGITGLISWFAMLVVLYRAGSRSGLGLLNPFFLIFLWFSFFSHNIFEMKFWIIAIAYFSLKKAGDWHGDLKLFGFAVNSNQRRRSKSAEVAIGGSSTIGYSDFASNTGQKRRRRKRRRPRS